MNKNDVAIVWDEMGLSCRNSFDPVYARKFCERLGLVMPDTLVYTKERYREQSDGRPRVDGEDLLEFVCKSLHIMPDPKALGFSYKFFGEGSRRDAVEEAYLG